MSFISKIDIIRHNIDMLRQLRRESNTMKRDVPSVIFSGSAELIESYGQDPLLIAEKSGFSGEALYSDELKVTGTNVCDFFVNSAKACKARFFGLEMAHQQGLQILGPIWLLMRNANTVGEAVSSLAKNFLLHTDITAISLEKEFGGISLCYEIVDEEIEFEAQVIEHGLALICFELRTLLGNQWEPIFTQFRYAAPYNLAPLKKVFGSNINFNQDRHAFHLSAQDLATPIDTSDIEHQKIIQRQLNSRLELTGSQIVTQTETVIRALITEEVCKLDKVASAIGISPRSLQRHLNLKGISFQSINDKIRLDMARKYLAHSNLSIGAIAERLHFSETAAFTRFFKRIAGITPRQFKKKTNENRL